jgi:hypothetical protein
MLSYQLFFANIGLLDISWGFYPVTAGISKKRLWCVMRIERTPASQPGVIRKSECPLCDLSVPPNQIFNHWPSDGFKNSTTVVILPTSGVPTFHL